MYENIKRLLFCATWPPLIVVIGEESVNKTKCSYDCSEQKHLSVETKPSKINANLLPIIISVEDRKNVLLLSNLTDMLPQTAALGSVVLPNKVERLLLEKAEEACPVFVESVSFTFTVRIFWFCPVSRLKAHRKFKLLSHLLYLCFLFNNKLSARR